jgi:EmrB/QacA subfamily drug resistance transporter
VTHEPKRQHYNVTLGVLVLAAMSYALLQTMVAPALPAIQDDLGASPNSVTWVLTIFLLSASIATPLLGRLGDMFGKERMLVLVLVVFGIGLLVSALSHSLPLLIAGRAIQGAAGAVFPLAFGIIRDEFPREKVATGIGLISATFGIGGGAGLILSGLIVDHLDYEWIFWFGLIGVAIAIVATHFFVPESPIKSPAKIDWAGAALMSAGLSLLLLAVSQANDWGWTSAPVLGLLVAAMVTLTCWVFYERGIAEPLVNMGLMRLRGVWTTNTVALLLGFGMYSSFILIPQLAQTPESTGYGFGASVTEAGLFMLPSTALMLVFGPLSGVLANRFGPRVPLIAGLGIGSLAFIQLAAAHSEVWEILLASALMGAGIGLSFASMANLIVGAVPQTHTGEATGINTIMRTVGGALGAQAVASILSGNLAADGLPAASGFTSAFAFGAVAMVGALLFGFAIPGRRAATAPAGARPAEARPSTRA